MTRYRILSLDGGGIRGVLTATLLERLEAAHPGFLEKIDLFAGTSTGGILALGLAAGVPPAEVRAMYEVKGLQVFADSIVDDLKDLGNSVGAQYSNGGLKEALLAQFGSKTLADLPGKVLISSYDLDNAPAAPGVLRTWKAKFFHNFPGEDSDGDQLVVDVALRTSAAPTYFPIYQGYVDGGVVANNPAMCALAQALDERAARQNLRDVVLLSLGTGAYSQFLTSQDGDWGWVQWAKPIIDIMLGGSMGLATFQCEQLLGKRFHRLSPVLLEPIRLDDVMEVPRLKALAQEVDLTETEKWLGYYFRDERRPSGRRTRGR